jgi:Transposase DDE domain group 1
MSKSNATQRIGQLKLNLLETKPAVISFDGDDVSGNAGVLLAGQVEKLTGLIRGAAARLDDHRTASLIKHSQFELVAQRVLQIVAGFPAGDDSDFLKGDPVIKASTGRDPLSGADLASQPTQSRQEGKRNFKELYRLSQWLVDYYIQCQRRRPKQLILDFDGSAIETYGVQLQAFYRSGPYRKCMYFPLFVFDQNGWLLVAALRPGDEGEVKLALPVLKKLVGRLRKAWPGLRITVRADGAFTHKELYRWMDDNNVHYVMGIKHNNCLLSKSRDERKKAKAKFVRKFGEPQFKGPGGSKRKLEKMSAVRSIKDPKKRRKSFADTQSRRVRVYGDFLYKAGSWDRERRVVSRCDYTDEGHDVRYVVTNIQHYTAGQIYEEFYCQRALAELWIKNLKETRCTRLSCSQFKANMFRLLLHALAYLLIHQVRLRLPEHCQRMSVTQFQRHFVHVAVQVHERNDLVCFRIAQSYHAAREFRLVSKRLGATSLLAA